MSSGLQQSGFSAHYRFESFERHGQDVDSALEEGLEAERLCFVDEAEAHQFLRGLQRDEPELNLRPLILELAAPDGSAGLGHARDSALAAVARALASGRLVATRIRRLPRVSDEPVLEERELVRPEPAPLDVEAPRVEAKLELEPPTKARARISHLPPPRVRARIRPAPRRLEAKLSPKAPRTVARVGSEGELAGTNISRSPRAQAKLAGREPEGNGTNISSSPRSEAKIELSTRRVRASLRVPERD